VDLPTIGIGGLGLWKLIIKTAGLKRMGNGEAKNDETEELIILDIKG
jgi:hypothetical protein